MAEDFPNEGKLFGPSFDKRASGRHQEPVSFIVNLFSIGRLPPKEDLQGPGAREVAEKAQVHILQEANQVEQEHQPREASTPEAVGSVPSDKGFVQACRKSSTPTYTH